MFDRIALISIPVKDQRAAKSFYTEKLGCTVKEENALRDAGYVVDQVSVAGSKHRTRARHLVPSDEARFRPGSGADHKKPRKHARETESEKIGHLRHQEAALGTRGNIPGPGWERMGAAAIKVIGSPTRVCGRPREGLE